MRRPSVQTLADIGWLALIVGFVVGDAAREQADIAADRTHTTGTTLSATWRRGLLALCRLLGVPRRHARYLNDAGLAVLGVWLSRHIGNHLDQHPADW